MATTGANSDSDRGSGLILAASAIQTTQLSAMRSSVCQRLWFWLLPIRYWLVMECMRVPYTEPNERTLPLR
ncbi:unnamed protein product [Toxocara canis]|uniref:Secreted protein n=1 Tax=Toxocara canis TaxID=6265 RepID=A0A183UEP7_TOXCA|nr:unnamed protein product [Toxocara canis]